MLSTDIKGCNRNRKVRDMIKLSDTIAAIATGMNQGGIGVIRVSGENAIVVADSIFVPKKKGKEIRNLDSYTAAYGNIVDKRKLNSNHSVLDESVNVQNHDNRENDINIEENNYILKNIVFPSYQSLKNSLSSMQKENQPLQGLYQKENGNEYCTCIQNG